MPDQTEQTDPTDRAELERVVAAFFDAFRTGLGCAERLDALPGLFLPNAVVVRTCGDTLAYDVAGFVAPRRALLLGGRLAEFSEWPVDGRLEQYGDVAHWWGSYAKEGTQDGAPYVGRGTKSIQLVRTEVGWRISAVAWDDER